MRIATVQAPGLIIITLRNLGWAPTTNSGILGIYKEHDILTITSCGHY